DELLPHAASATDATRASGVILIAFRIASLPISAVGPGGVGYPVNRKDAARPGSFPLRSCAGGGVGALRRRLKRCVLQPRNEWNSPRGSGKVGVNGSNLYGLLVSKPAFSAAPLLANGVRAATALLIEVQLSVRS